MGNVYDERKPALTAWVVQDDPNPDNWTVNIQATIMDAYVLFSALCEAAISYAEKRKPETAEFTYFMAEDIGLQLNRIGGVEAALRIAREQTERDGA